MQTNNGSYKEILKQFGEEVTDEVRAVARRFAPSVELFLDDTLVQVKASPYINTLVDGRRPTSPTAPKGDPTLQEALYLWIKETNIQPDDPDMTQLALSWAFATSIHKHGDRLYQHGGGRDVFANILSNERIGSLSAILGTEAERTLVETTLSGLTAI